MENSEKAKAHSTQKRAVGFFSLAAVGGGIIACLPLPLPSAVLGALLLRVPLLRALAHTDCSLLDPGVVVGVG